MANNQTTASAREMGDTKKFKLFSTIVGGLFSLIALIPIILIVIASFTDEKTLLANGYSFFPKK